MQHKDKTTMNPTRLFRLALLPAALAAGAAMPAHALDFNFSAAGFGVTGACNGVANCLEAFTVGDADDAGALVAGSWSQFLNLTLDTSTGAITGTWSLTDTSPAFNDLSGTVTGQWLSLSATQAQATLHYTITAGGGMFAGASGSGLSVLLTDADFNYTETGSFSVSMVPEPAGWALWMAGLCCAGALAARRPRAA